MPPRRSGQRIRAWLLLAATACACQTPTAPGVLLGQTFTLAPGARAVVTDASFSIRFIEVTGDSRCPVDAVCVQGGDAIVVIQVAPVAGTPVRYELHTGSFAPAIHDGYVVALVALTPFPFTTRTIEQREYRATLRVTKEVPVP